MTRPARTISISIDASPSHVYAFVSDPRNLAQWASGLGTLPTPLPDGDWRVETPAGPMRVAFAQRNNFGVVDHFVRPFDGEGPVVDVPMRVLPNADGSEVLLTLFQQPGMTDEQYTADGALVEADLARLKHVIEKGSR
jgi:carbon monoxide dehydrogenase subunit G